MAESCPGYPARVREDDKWSGASRPAYGELRLDDPETDELDDEFIRRACDRRQRAQGQQRLQMEAHTRAVPRVTGSRPRLLSGFHSVAVMPDDNHEAKGHIVQSVHARDGVDPLGMPSRVAAGVNRGRKARRNLLTSDKFRAQKQNLGWLRGAGRFKPKSAKCARAFDC